MSEAGSGIPEPAGDATPSSGSGADPLVGRTLADRYRILSKLGEGAMGTVYLGEHLRMGRRDAIKVLRGGLAQDTEAVARFTRGARNVSAIRHANVCAIYDFSNTDDGLQYLAMEYIEGETLRDTIEREVRIDVPRAVGIACEVADALQAAHDAGVVHRDLKPGNIMLCPRPDGSHAVKVVDFDIAKGPGEPEGEEVTRVGFVVGTPEYMSPEQLTGERLDGRSDLYSLGVVLYRMITGVLPFKAVSTQEIMVQRLTTEALKISDVLPAGSFPAALEPIVARALARSAGQRQASAADFARELRSITGGIADGARMPAAVELPPTRVAAAAVPPKGAMAGTRDDAVEPVARTWRVRGAMTVGAVAVIAALGLGANAFLRDRPAVPLDDPSTALSGDTTASMAGSAQDQTVPDGDAVAPDADVDRVAGLPSESAAGTSGDPPVTQRTVTAADPPAARRDTLMIYRQLDALDADPSPERQMSARDTALLFWNGAETRNDSVMASLVLARSAFALGNYGECATWARRGAALDNADLTANTIWSTLLQVCR